ncbi:MAG: hypothetical protein ACREJ3_18200, partial [Polyangiaceae bacterium]
ARVSADGSLAPPSPVITASPSLRPPSASLRPTSLRPPGAESDAGATLDAWFVEISQTKPLVIEVDNVDDADDASLGLLVALAKVSAEHPILLLVTERERREPRMAAGMVTLRTLCTRVSLSPLSPAESLELVRSLFGNAPNAERLAEWLHSRTAGNPLHCMEILRQLVARRVVHYMGGMWSLPTDRPSAELPTALEDALSTRLGSLSEAARGLAECLSLQRDQPTLELCRLLVQQADDRGVLLLLDELARNDVLYADHDGYRFSSSALRDALLDGMGHRRLQANHRRLGEAFAYLADPLDHSLRMQAGWHLIQGGDELQGADMIAVVTHSSVTIRTLVANLYHAGEAIEAALLVYKRHRLPIYARAPLLAALAHVGYYENRVWGDIYGDEALDACEDLCGLRSARNLSRFFGRWLGLLMGLLFAFVRFYLTPKRDRPYPFQELFVQLFGVVTTLTGAAALSLDVDRATRVAEVLEVFSVLPSRLTPVGIYDFCVGLREIGREHQALAYATFDVLRRRFEDPHFYPTLPADARPLYVTGAHFARGSFAVMREDGRAALESADALDASGFKLYAMIASQLRFLYYAHRGELAKAAVHREEVEMHAAHVGTAWQVETWEGASLIPVYANLGDVEALTRVARRLEELSRTVPSLMLYHRLANLSLMLVLNDSVDEGLGIAESELDEYYPRGFIGWASVHGYLAGAHNTRGDHAAAKAVCERALAHINDEDRECVTMFLSLDLEMARAEAGLGQIDDGLARIDALLSRFRESDHPLVQGLLHETRARICWTAGRIEEYSLSLALVEHWFRPTGTPALIARCDRLGELRIGPTRAPGSSQAATMDGSSTSHAVTGIESERLEAEARTAHLSVRRNRESA